MLDAIRSFVAELTGDERPADGLDGEEFRIAYAALLLHAASFEGTMEPAVRNQLRALLKQRFALDDAAVDELIAQAIDADEKSVDLYQFTRLVGSVLDDNGRLRMVEMMWTMAYADGQASDLEEHLIWRVADLLGVSSADRIALRNRVAEAHGKAP